MKWMEFIKVQTASTNVAANMQTFIDQCTECHGLLEAKIFRHALVADCSLFLRWNTDLPETQGSPVGLSLCNSLKQYGLVDHSVWIEKELNEENTNEN